MKRLLWILACCACFAGCSGGNQNLERALSLRSMLLKASECSFNTKVTADYTEQMDVFSMECICDGDGEIQFRVLEPETIAGISGSLSHKGGALTFDDTVLPFALLAEGQLSPVAAPWIFLKTLRSGYLASACMENDLLHLTMNDNYEEGALQVDIWINASDQPVRSEILYDGRRILTLDVADFRLA